MIQVTITPEIIARAKKKAATVGNLQGSITGSLSNVVGAIGEIIVADAIDADQSNTYDYDLVRDCLLYTSPSPRDGLLSRMPSSA